MVSRLISSLRSARSASLCCAEATSWSNSGFSFVYFVSTKLSRTTTSSRSLASDMQVSEIF
eukprot:14956246-Alexandrium_andersonii.AAC.1